jgi:hypothetical protein
MRHLAPLLSVVLAACSSSSQPDAAPVDAAPEVAADAPWGDAPVPGNGWSIVPPPGVWLARHDTTPDRWTFSDAAGAVVVTVQVVPWAGTLADYESSFCNSPDQWGWWCTSSPMKLGAHDALVMHVSRQTDGDAGAVGGFWRYVTVAGGRIYTFDFDDTIAASARDASVATIAISR